MVEIEPIRVELEREEDGRFLASVPNLPGVMAYGASEAEAVPVCRLSSGPSLEPPNS